MKLWTRPSHYVGAEWPDYYVFLGQHRDSDAVTRSNFRVGLARLGGETGEDDNGISMVTVVRESHWAVGWVEWIAIHKSNTDAIAKAEEMERRLADYPVLSDDDWSNLEYSEAMEYWDSCGMRERIRLCADCHESIFAARRDSDIPERVYQQLTCC